LWAPWASCAPWFDGDSAREALTGPSSSVAAVRIAANGVLVIDEVFESWVKLLLPWMRFFPFKTRSLFSVVKVMLHFVIVLQATGSGTLP